MPIAGTAEEDEHAGERVRRAAVCAGSLRIMRSVKPAGCCRRVCGFRYADDMPAVSRADEPVLTGRALVSVTSPATGSQ
jgi:hypothetical protein